MSRPTCSRRRYACVAIVVFSFTFHLEACGPFFPESLLSSDNAVLTAPTGNLEVELSRISAGLVPQFSARVSTNDPVAQTADADLADLRLVVKDERVIAAYQSVRAAETTQSSPSPSAAKITGLPEEFGDYLSGALAFHQGNFGVAKASWEALLRRTAPERRYRSTWAAFMLGKSWLDDDPPKAITYFRQVRELARSGFVDSLGLAAASLGWEARAEVYLGNPAEALELYLAQYSTGDPTAIQSIQFVAPTVLQLADDDLRAVARRENVRQVLTAYIVAQGGPFHAGPEPVVVLKWLSTLEAVGADHLKGADRLAWAAYQIGQWDIARRWLARAPAQSFISQWLRTKLLLQDGKLKESAQVMSRLARRFPVESESREAYTSFGPENGEDWGFTNTAIYIHGELGALQLARGQFVDALDSLVRAGYWLDAAYVAERVLSVDELIRYVDHHAPKDARDLRYLLARRLTRLNRFDEARRYFEPDLQAKLDLYSIGLRIGHDSSFTALERSTALWRAARTARWWGLALLSTEVEPDWYYAGGNFELEDSAEQRQVADGRKLIAAGGQELARTDTSLIAINERFHYRQIAAALAWEAAELMPRESDATARALCEAGTWLKFRNPQAADRFYKALVRRCGTTALGQEADCLRWFPEIEAD